MAPELNERRLYAAEKVDTFAAGVVLFIMRSGTPPFNYAAKDEYYYKCLHRNRPDMFWKFHTKNKPYGEQFFSATFKDLIEKLFAYDETQRLSVD